MCVYIYIYIYMYRERERKKYYHDYHNRAGQGERPGVPVGKIAI